MIGVSITVLNEAGNERLRPLFSFAEYPVARYGDEGGENPP